MEGKTTIEIYDEDKDVFLKIKSGIDLSIFDNDYLDKDDIHFRALKLDKLYHTFFAISSNREAFGQLIEKMYSKGYINDEVIAVVKTYTPNLKLKWFLEIAFPDVKPFVSKEIQKIHKLNELSNNVMKIYEMQRELISDFKNIDKFDITEKDLKEHLLLDVRRDYLNSL
jgi:hypothetical protein